MLPQNRRLRAFDVERVLKVGFSIVGGSIRLKAIERKEALLSRFAVIVSKKVAGGAVMRNHLRRQAFEAIFTSPTLKKANDVVVMVGKKYNTFSELNQDIQLVLNKLR